MSHAIVQGYVVLKVLSGLELRDDNFYHHQGPPVKMEVSRTDGKDFPIRFKSIDFEIPRGEPRRDFDPVFTLPFSNDEEALWPYLSAMIRPALTFLSIGDVVVMVITVAVYMAPDVYLDVPFTFMLKVPAKPAE